MIGFKIEPTVFLKVAFTQMLTDIEIIDKTNKHRSTRQISLEPITCESTA